MLVHEHDLSRTIPRAEELPVSHGWRELWQVAWPLMISSGSLSLMLVVDRAFLAWHSTEALAAALPAGALFWTVASLAIGTAQYVNTFVAQYLGAGRPERVGASVWHGVYFSLLSGALMCALGPGAEWIFARLGHEESLRRLEAEYFSALCYGGIPTVLATALSCFYSGRGRTIVVMWVNVAAAVLNAVLDPALIFGWWGFPALGIGGAAVATIAGNVLAVLLYGLLMARDVERHALGLVREWRFDAVLWRRLLRFGLPQGGQALIDVLCFTLFVQMIGTLGTSQLAATSLAFTLNTLAFVPLLGLGMAVTVLVGQRIGEGRPHLAARTTWQAFSGAAAYMLLFGLAYLTLPDVLLWPYRVRMPAEEFVAMREIVVVLLRFVAVYSLFDAMAVIFGAAIRGAGDTRFALIFSAATGWLLLLVPTYVAQHVLGQGLLISWTIVTAFAIVLGIGFWLRFLGGRWRTMRVIEVDATSA